MKKLVALPLVVPLIVSGGPELAAALWAPAVGTLPLTFIASLAACKPPWTRLFVANVAVVVMIGLIAASDLRANDDLDKHGRAPIEGLQARPAPGPSAMTR